MWYSEKIQNKVDLNLHEQSVFLLFSIATKRKFTQLLVTTKSAPLLQVEYQKTNVPHWPQREGIIAKA